MQICVINIKSTIKRLVTIKKCLNSRKLLRSRLSIENVVEVIKLLIYTVSNKCSFYPFVQYVGFQIDHRTYDFRPNVVCLYEFWNGLFKVSPCLMLQVFGHLLRVVLYTANFNLGSSLF